MSRFVSAPRCNSGRAGFALLEALVALAIAAAILSGVASIAGSALRNWSRGHNTIAAIEMLTRGLGRLATDISLALPVRAPGSEDPILLFKGDATNLVFVAATGFGAGNRGVELISISLVADEQGSALIRKRGPVANLATVLSDPVVLMRGRLGVAFSYRDAKGIKVATWSGRTRLPSAVEIAITGPSGATIFPVAAVMPIPITVAAECLQSGSGKGDQDSTACEEEGSDDGVDRSSSSDEDDEGGSGRSTSFR